MATKKRKKRKEKPL